jgi:RNA polymerase sigma factor (sigma-70 family)
MKGDTGLAVMAADRDRRIADAVERQGRRLLNFIRKRVPDAAEAEDILQDVFSELVEAYRMSEPIEQVGAWLFRVARNRITDLFRRRRPLALSEGEDRLPSAEEGPEVAYARRVMIEELEAALEELPPEQRDVFLAHEVEGHSFKELSAETGIPVNTLLSRKRYAVLHLRRRLRALYEELMRS